MKQKIIIMILLSLLTIISCNNSGNNAEIPADVTYNMVADDEAQAEKPDNNIAVERKMIKEGEISFESENVKETRSLITRIVEESGGYISKDNNYSSKDRISHRLVIRVPAERFDLLLSKISESAEKLDYKNIEVLDVTEEYIDIEARIKTKKELENRYKELLGQAKTVEEILKIEKELGILRTEIESVEGRLRYLKDQIGYSTLNVEYYQRTSSATGFSLKIGRALVTGWDWLLTFIIGLAHIWPFILITGLIIFLAILLDRKKISRQTKVKSK